MEAASVGFHPYTVLYMFTLTQCICMLLY